MQYRQMLVIARPRRTMWISMVGTITQSHRGAEKRFEYGVQAAIQNLITRSGSASEEDLDIIFDKAATEGDPAARITIGKSPIFTDYDVTHRHRPLLWQSTLPSLATPARARAAPSPPSDRAGSRPRHAQRALHHLRHQQRVRAGVHCARFTGSNKDGTALRTARAAQRRRLYPPV